MLPWPVITADGGETYKSDIWSLHDYAQDSLKMAVNIGLKDGKYDFLPYHISKSVSYDGQPIMVGEYGGIKWGTDPVYKNSWGYGQGQTSIERGVLQAGTIDECNF